MTVLVLAMPVAVFGLAVALLRRVVVTVGVNEHSGVVEIARHTRGWRVVGLVLGGVAAVLLLTLGQRVDDLGRVTALAPTALGAGVLAGTIVGELTARPSVGIRRSAVACTAAVVAPLALGGAAGLLVGLVLTPTIRVDDLPRPLPGEPSPVGAPVR